MRIITFIISFLFYSVCFGQAITRVRVATLMKTDDPYKKKILYEKIYYDKYDNTIKELRYEADKTIRTVNNKYKDSILLKSTSFYNNIITEKTLFIYDKAGKLKNIKSKTYSPILSYDEYAFIGDTLEIVKHYTYYKGKRFLTGTDKTIKNSGGKMISELGIYQSETRFKRSYTYFGDSLIIEKEWIEGNVLKTHILFDSMHRVKKEIYESKDRRYCKSFFYSNDLLVLVNDSARNGNPSTAYIYWPNGKIKEIRDIDEDGRGDIEYFNNNGYLDKKERLSSNEVLSTLFYSYQTFLPQK